jgi:hypothetical protein
MSTPAALYAGFWRRAAAYFVDGLVLVVPGTIIGFVLHADRGLATIGQILLYWLYTALLSPR